MRGQMPPSVASVLLTLQLAAGASKAATTRYELRDYVPSADPAATHVVGDARFTVLSSQLLRMEYKGAQATGFEDRPTLAFVNRRQPVPAAALLVRLIEIDRELSALRAAHERPADAD